jgi:hypothetical protein
LPTDGSSGPVGGDPSGPGIQPTDPDVAPGGSAAWPWGGDDAAGPGSAGDSTGVPGSSSDPADSSAAGPVAGTIDDGSAGGGAAGGGSTGAAAGGAGTGGAGASGNGVGALGGTGSWGALTAALDVLGIRPSTTTTVLPMLVGTTTATAMAFAFAIFGKKRRDEEPPAPDEVLQAQAARGHDRVPGAEVLAAGRASVAPIDAAEAGMPRWRRPSVQAARKSDPNRYVDSGHMSFDNGLVSAIEGHERRIIRYRVVRLLDAPDELRSTDIGQLDQGDEVQLLERSGAYWKVLCPDGRQGWLHKMTLGEVVRDEAPAPAQSWSADVDDDVLTAFLTARARA